MGDIFLCDGMRDRGEVDVAEKCRTNTFEGLDVAAFLVEAQRKRVNERLVCIASCAVSFFLKPVRMQC